MNTPLPTVELSTGADPVASIIVMHGLGADGSDFAPFVDEIDLRAVGPVRCTEACGWSPAPAGASPPPQPANEIAASDAAATGLNVCIESPSKPGASRTAESGGRAILRQAHA